MISGQEWIGQQKMDVFAPKGVDSYQEVILEELRKRKEGRVCSENVGNLIENQRALCTAFGLYDVDLFLKALHNLYMKRLITILWSTREPEFRSHVSRVALTKKFLSAIKTEILR